ncbi:3-phosphoshikimate 1-carboxyvinyltransferase [Clostridium estertheticum]|uniref:3-phosphoshikimate 1-carboxyvinyltransferase n=1 Tax=Clostridium estertheticum TaxID=238834 RepID=UPI001C0DC29D|nr:3-phosphoshikimate 1-carboxyvinyltransferase [Clostridium estertheticum]MBU3201685.1 3-phosphoshikimate 1-carboxyvinyltransferase [Clostridium estertheticum]WAG63959.1 3-phosphoshikimate 1-carboxyvinyltransferase [Clostridium estertheticum]
MKSVIIKPSYLNGKVKIPPSKSLSHRAVIAAGLSNGKCSIDNISMSEDIIATCEIMEKLGVDIKRLPSNIKVCGKGKPTFKLSENLSNELQCNESGSTLRFLIPIAMLTGEKIVFNGKSKLVQRTLKPYYDIFDKHNIKYNTNNGNLPLTVEGSLEPGVFELRGDVSSQFITGLIYSLPLLDGDSIIMITTKMESIGYIDLTLDVLSKFGVKIENNNYREFKIKGNQHYNRIDYRVEGDFSQAAFYLAAGVLGGEVECMDLNMESLQGDKVIVDIIKNMGGNITIKDGILKASKSNLKGTIVDASQCPDLVPIVAVLASLSEGTTEIINAGRVRIKESDRLKAMATELNKIGAEIIEKEDSLIIHGKPALRGGVVSSWNDHRIAMAMAIASIRCSKELTIEDSGAVKKSYPEFYEDFKSLGGKINERTMG